MIKKLKLTVLLFLLLVSLGACYKKDLSNNNNPTDPIDPTVAKAWLNQNGLSYKDEMIKVNVSNQIITGKLNWQKAKEYFWKEKAYIEIPFEFEGFGSLTPNGATIASAGFNLVIRKKNSNDFEGAIRTTLYGAESESVTGQLQKKIVQLYRYIDGREANIWVSGVDDSNPVAAYRSAITDEGFLSLKQIHQKHNGTVMRNICTPSTITVYDMHCYYATPEQEANQHATCVSVPQTLYLGPQCATDVIANDTDSYPPGGGVSSETSEIDSEASSPKKVDCESFDYVKTSTANWQEAGVKKIRLRWIYIEPTSRHGFLREIWVDKIVFGLPTYYTNANGTITHLSAGEAATRSAILLDQAKTETYLRFKESNADEATVIMYFKKTVHEYMTTQMGTAGATGSGSPDIKFKDEDRSNWTDPYDC